MELKSFVARAKAPVAIIIVNAAGSKRSMDFRKSGFIQGSRSRL